MAAKLNSATWAWPLTMALMAVPVGVLAGLRPEVAVLAAAGVTFALVVLSDLAIGVAIFTLITFFELLPDVGGSAVSLTKLAGIALAISWFATLTIRGDPRTDFLRQHPLVSSALILFVAWAVLSFAWSEFPGGALTAASRLALNALLVLIVFTAVRTERDAIRVLAAFVTGAIGAVAYGLLSGVDATAFSEGARLSGQTENPNQLATTLVAALTLSLGLAFAAPRSPALRALALGAAGLALLGIVLTISRGGLVALGVAAVAAIAFGGKWRAQVALLSTFVAICALGYFVALAPPAAQERVTDLEGGTGREDIWTVGWRMVEDQPVRGIGAGNFQTSSIHYLLAPGVIRRTDLIVDTPKVAHNLYLQVFAELGVIGLVLFLFVIFGLLRSGVLAAWQFERNGDLRMEILARAQVIAVVAILASLFFSSDAYKKQLWLLFAMLPTMLAIAGSSRVSERD